MLSITGTITGTITVRHKSNRATIKEVASAAGVSTQTVSRVINNRPDVSPETRKHVQEVIDQLDYQPSALARSLIRQRSYTLGVVTAGLKYIGPSRTLSGITHAAEEAGYSLLLKELPSFETNETESIFQKLFSRHVDGIIWAVPEVGENRNWVDPFTLVSEVPIVYLTMEPIEGLSIVSIDNYYGGKTATLHLIEQGYKNIGHIAGPLSWWEARQRKTGWRDALEEAGLEAGDRQWVEGTWSAASGNRLIPKLYSQFPEMDAIFVSNDQMALSVLQYACNQGIRVPEDLGVVGFDNIPESAYFWPPLTTIDQNLYQVGEAAVREVIKIIEEQKEEQRTLEVETNTFKTNLVERQSSLRNKVKGGVSGK
ncbi:MAG: LacI family DNA-binding transcriptional regulator [Anaerolineales bacterium]|jgi:LacI family transcriptional regulator